MPRGRPGSNFTYSRECKECEGMIPHTPKWNLMLGVRVPKGLLNFQNAITGVKTHCLEEFFISLKSYWNVDVWNGLVLPISTFETQVMVKRKVGSQIGNLTRDHEKSGINPISLRAGGVRHTIEKLFTRATTLLQTASQSKVCTRSYAPSKLRETQVWDFRDSHLGVPWQKTIWMWPPWKATKYTIRGKVVASFKSRSWWVLCVWVARGSS
jgi:hypothetical protein